MDFEKVLENEPVNLVCDREREVLEVEAIYHAIYESIQLRKVEH